MSEIIYETIKDSDGADCYIKRGEVVRCEECIFYMAMGENRALGKCRIHDRTAQDIDYCSWGERGEL